MRTLASTLLACAAAGASLGAAGCKWTEFDELEQDMWVAATGKPNTDSTDWGIALARGSRVSASGGKLVVFGAVDAQFTELGYGAAGDVDLLPTSFRLGEKGVTVLETQPLVLADPTSDTVVLFASGGADNAAAMFGAGNLEPQQIFGFSLPDAAAFVAPPARPGEAAAPAAIPVVASGNTVYPVYLGESLPLTGAPAASPRCDLTSNGMDGLKQIVGLAGARVVDAVAGTPDGTDDLVVWTEDGTLYVYEGDGVSGAIIRGVGAVCEAQPARTATPVDTGYQPDRTSQLLRVDDTHVLLVGRQTDGGTESLLALYDLAAADPGKPGNVKPALVGATVTAPSLRTAALLELPGAGGAVQRYVVAGYPLATVDGVAAGKVEVYPLSLSTGLGLSAMTLHDAQPEDGQLFGRALAVTPFNGQPVLAVGADNEVFTYFRTALYDDTRTR